ncbi:MAG: tRNA glutamyl-Q(34) synthetase GluQRS, partial [Desulfovibrio sp.]|nr:tRNA glutamyl-Q(34) synthetase GluQRS [Desulfovibrio sp.]
WLGLDWDEGYGRGLQKAASWQSARKEIYFEALNQLRELGRVYPCFCTRKELKNLASAPHPEDVGPVYPGTCKHLSASEQAKRLTEGKAYALRLDCPAKAINFVDLCCGEQSLYPADWGGDFILQRSDGVFAYQLAVAVDDALMGVSQVVRGRDILCSTGKQLLLLELLQWPKPAEYAHLPLLNDASGERLAKRHHSLALQTLRREGVKAEQIIALVGYLAGLIPMVHEISLKELLAEFAFAKLPKHDLTLRNDLCTFFLNI